MLKMFFFVILLLTSHLVMARHESKSQKEEHIPVNELQEEGYELGEVNNRIKVRSVSNWQRLNSQYVLVEGKSKKNSRLIKFKRNCVRSKSATFVYEVRNGTLTNLDIIKVVDYPFGIRKVCIIDEIYQLDFVGKPNKKKKDNKEKTS